MQPLGRQEAEPEEWRHRRVGGVLGEPPRGIHERLLNHVRRVDAPLQPPVQSELDHPAESLAVRAKNSPSAPLIPCMDAAQQDFIVVRIGRHARVLLSL